MNIGIDIRVLARGARSGVEEYTTNMLSHLLPLARHHRFVLFYNAFAKVPLVAAWRGLPHVTVIERSIPNKFLEYASFFFNAPKIDRLMGGVDIFISPHVIPAAVSNAAKKILVFHDLSFLYYPEFFPVRKRLWHSVAKPYRQAQCADAIIAMSQSTKNDLVRLWGIAEEKITVVYQAHSGSFIPAEKNAPEISAVRKKYGLPEKYILFLATLEPRKNARAVIDAYVLARRKYGIAQELVIAGQRGWLESGVFAHAKRYGKRSGVRFIGAVGEHERARLYQAADMFVYPSFFEGFGLPPLEAMACGTPAIVSGLTSLTEVAGEAALAADPFDVDRLSFLIAELARDERLRSEYARRGIARAALFSWESSAKAMLAIIDALAVQRAHTPAV